ncbi:uncharacterized protein LOC111116385 isoform X1 [Crassostrea virginica]
MSWPAVQEIKSLWRFGMKMICKLKKKKLPDLITKYEDDLCNAKRNPPGTEPSMEQQQNPPGTEPSMEQQQNPPGTEPSITHTTHPMPLMEQQRNPPGSEPSTEQLRNPPGTEPSMEQQGNPPGTEPSMEQQQNPPGTEPSITHTTHPMPLMEQQWNPPGSEPSMEQLLNPPGTEPSITHTTHVMPLMEQQQNPSGTEPSITHTTHPMPLMEQQQNPPGTEPSITHTTHPMPLMEQQWNPPGSESSMEQLRNPPGTEPSITHTTHVMPLMEQQQNPPGTEPSMEQLRNLPGTEPSITHTTHVMPLMEQQQNPPGTEPSITHTTHRMPSMEQQQNLPGTEPSITHTTHPMPLMEQQRNPPGSEPSMEQLRNPPGTEPSITHTTHRMPSMEQQQNPPGTEPSITHTTHPMPLMEQQRHPPGSEPSIEQLRNLPGTEPSITHTSHRMPLMEQQRNPPGSEPSMEQLRNSPGTEPSITHTTHRMPSMEQQQNPPGTEPSITHTTHPMPLMEQQRNPPGSEPSMEQLRNPPGTEPSITHTTHRMPSMKQQRNSPGCEPSITHTIHVMPLMEQQQNPPGTEPSITHTIHVMPLMEQQWNPPGTEPSITHPTLPMPCIEQSNPALHMDFLQPNSMVETCYTQLQTKNHALNSELHNGKGYFKMPQMFDDTSLLYKHCKTPRLELPPFNECFNSHPELHRNTLKEGHSWSVEADDSQSQSEISTSRTELNLSKRFYIQPQGFCATLETDSKSSDKGEKLLRDVPEMNFSDDDDNFNETDSDGDSVYIPDFDCNSDDEYSDKSDEYELSEENRFVLGKNQSKNSFTSNQHNFPQKVNTRESVGSDSNSHVHEESYDGNSSHQEESQGKLSVNNTSEEAAPFKRDVLPSKCICDETNPRIYAKKYEQNSSNSKHGRLYDRVHACLFCKKLMTHIQTHLQSKHKNELDVKEILELKKQIEEIKENNDKKSGLKKQLHKMQTLIRNRGNNCHNQKVLAVEEGEILLSRRRNSNTFDVRDYGPCPYCEEWIVLQNITKHMTTCPSQEKSSATKGSSIIQSKIMTGKISSSASTKLRTEVFPSMIRDNITEIAQGDHLITVLGNIWLMKNVGNKLRRKNFTSFRMRLSARLLSILRADAQLPSASMDYFLSPKQFDRVVSCAVKACKEDENEDLKNPSTAIKLGYDLSRLANAKLGIAIKEGNDGGKKEAGEFLQLLRMEWSVKVTKLARVTLDLRHFNKKKELPDPSDIEKIAAYLVREIKKLDLTISNCSEIVFREAIVLTEARLLIYNRRRPGELESLRVEAYKNRSQSVDEANMALRTHLTDFERMLLKTQDLVEIRGKTGRGVPVLIPNETKEVLNYLSNPIARIKANIKPENPYMFANTGNTVVRAGESLEQVKFRDAVGLRFPGRIYANNLRKHTATIAQALNLNDTEMKSICNHLGHTQKVHDLVYRQTSGMIERLDIAKLMLIQEHNIVGKFQNKKLSEIQFDELETLEEKACLAQVGEQQDVDGTDDFQAKDWNDDLAMDIEEEFSTRKKAKKTERVRWSKEEEGEIKEYFSSYFDGSIPKKCPSREHCLLAISKSKASGGNICRRQWETLKKKVSNMLIKLRD